MLRLVPDWLLYIVVIAVVVFVLFKVDQRSNAPEALPEAPETGGFLPPPSVYDPEILVEVGPQSSGLGSAFAISSDGWWVTARHVVDACSRVGIIVSRGAAAPVRQVRVAQFADLALLKTDRAPSPLAIDASERMLQVGQRAFHVGFPQGRPGEVYSRLIGRENLIARGRYQVDEPVLTWAELGRTSGMGGTLAGMSGGPAFDASGQVIGVTIAESARRGRIYTASPATIMHMLRVEQVAARGNPAPHFTTDNYGQESDALRRSLAVAQVVCVTDDTPS
ncbi:MAG: trypsin-like peptidase domain-containing protein [Proteobacteria bacterium]|nr:trypsin-like peptidase domain-containing protein [Pseudomonadota bacterium]